MMKKTAIILGILLVAVLPVAAGAAGTGIWKGTTCAANSPTGGPTESCGFCDILVVVQNVILYVMTIASAVAVGMIVLGGLRLMTGGGSETAVSEGRQRIVNAVIGLAITLGAWLVVNVVLHLLTGNVDFPWNTIKCIIR